ncbi:hypothetical protein Droror1_Dr00018147 [Drosera rotundifolia]
MAAISYLKFKALRLFVATVLKFEVTPSNSRWSLLPIVIFEATLCSSSPTPNNKPKKLVVSSVSVGAKNKTKLVKPNSTDSLKNQTKLGDMGKSRIRERMRGVVRRVGIRFGFCEGEKGSIVRKMKKSGLRACPNAFLNVPASS